MTAIIKGVEVELGGENRIVPPLSFGDIKRILPKLKNVDINGTISDEMIDTITDAVASALRRNYPTITNEDVAGWLDLSNFQQVFEAIMKTTGLERRKVTAGEAPAGSSTGTSSTAT